MKKPREKASFLPRSRWIVVPFGFAESPETSLISMSQNLLTNIYAIMMIMTNQRMCNQPYISHIALRKHIYLRATLSVATLAINENVTNRY